MFKFIIFIKNKSYHHFAQSLIDVGWLLQKKREPLVNATPDKSIQYQLLHSLEKENETLCANSNKINYCVFTT